MYGYESLTASLRSSAAVATACRARDHTPCPRATCLRVPVLRVEGVGCRVGFGCRV